MKSQFYQLDLIIKRSGDKISSDTSENAEFWSPKDPKNLKKKDGDPKRPKKGGKEPKPKQGGKTPRNRKHDSFLYDNQPLNLEDGKRSIFGVLYDYDKEQPIPKQEDMMKVSEDLQNRLIKNRKKGWNKKQKKNWEEHAYDESQLSVKECKRQLNLWYNDQKRKLKRQFDEVDETLKKCQKQIEKAQEMKNRDEEQKYTNKEHSLLEKWISARAQLDNLEAKRLDLPIFHPKDNIKAIKKVYFPKERRTQFKVRYYAYCEEQGGRQICKEIPYDWIRDNFDSLYLEAVDRHNHEKGWISFDEHDKLQYFDTEEKIQQLQSKCKNIYTYKPKQKGDLITFLKARIKFECDNLELRYVAKTIQCMFRIASPKVD